MLTFYGHNTINSLKVSMMLFETQLEHEFVPVNIRAGAQHKPAFLKVNANAKVPVLIDAGETLVESNSILLYLAEKTAWGLAAPETSRQALSAWLFYQASTQGPYFGQIEYWAHSAKQTNPEALAHYRSIAARTIAYFEGALKGQNYLCGDRYSIADIACFPWLRGCENLELSLDDAPNLSRWRKNILARPASQKAIEFLETNAVFDRPLSNS